MVTAKKVSTPKPAAVVAPAPAKPVAVKKPVAKKAASPVVSAKTAALAPAPAKAKPKASVAKPKTSSAAKTKAALDTEQRNHYVQVAAFYIAERRGFAPGNPTDDWAAAEAEVDRLIASSNFTA